MPETWPTGLYRGPSPTRGSKPYVSRVGPPYRSRRVTIIGEAPTSDVREAYDTATGEWLLDLSGGVTMAWHNIHGAKPPRWSHRVAKQRVRDWISQHQGESEPFILLGRRVARALRVPPDMVWLDWYRTSEHAHPLIPFPLLGDPFWQDEDNVRTASDLLVALNNGALPHFDFKKRDETA